MSGICTKKSNLISAFFGLSDGRCNHQSENAICERCGVVKLCTVYCARPKDNIIHKKCEECIKIEAKENDKLLDELLADKLLADALQKKYSKKCTCDMTCFCQKNCWHPEANCECK